MSGANFLFWFSVKLYPLFSPLFLMMKNLFLLITALLVSFSLYSCGTDSGRSYTGKHLELDFSGPGAISGGSWVVVDELRFEHYDRHEELISKPFALPATTVFHVVEAGDREAAGNELLPEPFTRLDIAIRIGNFLSQNPGPDFRYENSSPQLMMLAGKLRIRRSDGEPITIQLPADYPVTVSILE